jgi:hypothetical protein
MQWKLPALWLRSTVEDDKCSWKTNMWPPKPILNVFFLLMQDYEAKSINEPSCTQYLMFFLVLMLLGSSTWFCRHCRRSKPIAFLWAFHELLCDNLRAVMDGGRQLVLTGSWASTRALIVMLLLLRACPHSAIISSAVLSSRHPAACCVLLRRRRKKKDEFHEHEHGKIG